MVSEDIEASGSAVTLPASNKARLMVIGTHLMGKLGPLLVRASLPSEFLSRTSSTEMNLYLQRLAYNVDACLLPFLLNYEDDAAVQHIVELLWALMMVWLLSS